MTHLVTELPESRHTQMSIVAPMFRGLRTLAVALSAIVVSSGACTPSSSPKQEKLPQAERLEPRAGGAQGTLDSREDGGAPPPSSAPAPSAAEPTFVARPYTECGMPKSLLARGWARQLSPTAAEEPAPPQDGTVTLAVLPDTQYYAACNSPHFHAQSRWVADEAAVRNVVATIHLGDITEHNTEQEWDYARRSLEPLLTRLPTILTTGNHDHGDGGTANRRWTLFNDYFARPAPATQAVLSETQHEGDLENAYYRIRLPKGTLGVLVLEWSPRSASVAWADQVLSKYRDDRVIFVTHAYLYHDGTRYDFAGKGPKQEWNVQAYGTGKRDASLPPGADNIAVDGAHDGQMLWQGLVRRHPGVFLTLNGHVLGDGAGLLTSTGNSGNRVHQVLVNYQMLDEGGLGYLRLIELSPDGTTMRMKTYSPSLRRFATGSDQDFELDIEPPLWR